RLFCPPSPLPRQNQELLAENRALRERTRRLAQENRQLRLRLGLPAHQGREEEEEAATVATAGSRVEVELGLGPATGSSESAALRLRVPPQQGQAQESPRPRPRAAPAWSLAATALALRPGGRGLMLSAFPLLQPDLLLGLLDCLDPDIFLHLGGGPEPASLEQGPPEEGAGQGGSLPASPASPLGAFPPRLEAINELIRFDHEYTKPFTLQRGAAAAAAAEGTSQAVGGRAELAAASFSSGQVFLEPSLSVKEEPVDLLLPELGISHLLSPDQKPLMDASSDSGYEGSPSPFSELSSPLGTDYVWDEAFANELFPQLLSV
ncbi:X-box-binding protein 1, partial [Sphaerodactylus townsendi]|uniref:X-box-binding protein 1 n=1 Tax=Sphaerodactylus townsendi TaxID=933632 RepID=UPI00202665E9